MLCTASWELHWELCCCFRAGMYRPPKKRRFTTAVMYHSAQMGKHGQPVLGTGTINGMTKTKQRQCIPESNLPWRHYRRENIITDPAGEGKYP